MTNNNILAQTALRFRDSHTNLIRMPGHKTYRPLFCPSAASPFMHPMSLGSTCLLLSAAPLSSCIKFYVHHYRRKSRNVKGYFEINLFFIKKKKQAKMACFFDYFTNFFILSASGYRITPYTIPFPMQSAYRGTSVPKINTGE